MPLTRIHLHRSGFQFKIPDRFHMNKGFHCLKRRVWGGVGQGSHIPIAVLPCCVKKFGIFFFFFITMWNSLKDFKQGRLLYNGITGWLKRGRVEAGRPPWGLVPSITCLLRTHQVLCRPGKAGTWLVLFTAVSSVPVSGLDARRCSVSAWWDGWRTHLWYGRHFTYIVFFIPDSISWIRKLRLREIFVLLKVKKPVWQNWGLNLHSFHPSG